LHNRKQNLNISPEDPVKKLLAYVGLGIVLALLGFEWYTTDQLAAQGIFCESRYWMIASSNKPACEPKIVFAGTVGYAVLGLTCLVFVAALIMGGGKAKQ
jgi:hypothetical protein